MIERGMRFSWKLDAGLGPKWLLVGVLLSMPLASFARDFSGCSSQFYQQTPPQLLRDTLRSATFPLCFSGFAVMYSGVSRTPLWSAEHLTPDRLQKARGLDRQGEFHEESRIPLMYRSRLSDYARSGYDRGHMSPNGDMGDRTMQADSFSLANMVPQSPYNNQEVWRNLEEATRALVLKQHWDAYVITGPAFLGGQVQQVGRVLVPTHVYKVVYFPDQQAASAYLAVNDQQAALQVITLKQLQRLIGIDVLPQLSDHVKSQLVNLPLNANQARRRDFDLWNVSSLPDTSNLPEVAMDHSADNAPQSRTGATERTTLTQQLLLWMVNRLAKNN